MIEAYFATSQGGKIPALVPNDEVLELAAMAEMTPQDLFCIDIPGGATREARVRALVPWDQLSTLYGSNTYGTASTNFSWREDDVVSLKTLPVWLLPPRPLFVVPGGAGVAVVEAVDVRWWWKQQQFNAENTSPVLSYLFSSDGRWRTAGHDKAIELDVILNEIKALLQVGTFGSVSYTPSTNLRPRIADLVFTPETSLAMAIDLILASTGYVMICDVSSGALNVVPIQSNDAMLGIFMGSNKRAAAGGQEATSGTAAASEPLLSLWQGNANFQANRMPSKVTVSFPYRSIEGKTYYDNALTPVPSDTVEFAKQRELGWERTVSTVRARGSVAASRVLKEPLTLVASLVTAANPTTPSTNMITGIAQPWNWSDYVTTVVDLLAKRCEVSYGRTVWAGWPTTPSGAYRATECRFTLGLRRGNLCPITITAAQIDDWILGPNGLTPDNPKDIVMSKGLAHARRLGNGVLTIDVAPPYCRAFLAKITGATRIGNQSGNDPSGYWRWLYSYEEQEPNPDANSPIGVGLGNWARTGQSKARNVAEQGNNYVAAGNSANVIAPGVKQSDYNNATIDALPVVTGTLVLMVEQFPTAYLGPGGQQPVSSPQYDREVWFCMPNAVKVTCGTVQSFDGG